VELRTSAALDALRKAKLTGSVRDASILVLGAWLVGFSAALPPLQEDILVGIGATLSISEAIILVMRSVRSFRSGREL
jgi:hypothetical protein